MRSSDVSGVQLLPVGQRIEFRRRRQRLSRRLVADLVGRSEEWLRLVEKGRLRLDSVGAILRLAEVLQIDDYRELIDSPAPAVRRPTNPAQDFLGLLVPLLFDHPRIGAFAAEVRDVPQHVGDEWLNAEVARCEEIWANSSTRCALLARRLPRLLGAGQEKYWHDDTDVNRYALIRLLHVSRAILTYLNAHDLAAMVADRVMALTRRSDDCVLLAASSWHWASALLHLEQGELCRAFAVAAAQHSALDLGDRRHAVLYGSLHLLAAQGAAVSSPAESARLFAVSRELAGRIGADQVALGISFGSSEIGLALMETALCRRDFRAVIDAATEIAPADRMPLGRRARYFITLAAAYAGQNEIVSAVFALTQAAEACPDDLRHDPDAHVVLRQITESDYRLLGPQITRLADLAGFR
jgi:transcriptional regulator with XRE-family HTH domain